MINRRTFISKSAAAAAAAIISPSLLGVEPRFQEKSSLDKKKILFVWGGWAGHEPEQTKNVIVPWMESEGAIMTVSDTLDAYATMDLKGFDLIIQTWTMGEISRAQLRPLLAAVDSGVGLAGWHGGIGDSFRASPEFMFMTGGYWAAHPGNVKDFRVNIVDQKDPVTKGLSDFDVHSEQYYMLVDPNVKVLATSTINDNNDLWIEGNVLPVVWKKVYGKGRVFYSSLCHKAVDWDVYETFEIQKRGIRWASMSKYEPMEEWKQPAYKNWNRG